MQVYALLHTFCKEIAPTWRKTQVTNLSLLAGAIFTRRSLSVAELARAYPKKDKRKVAHPKHGLFHRLKRVRRFLANSKLDLEAVFVRLTRLSYSVCQSPGLLLPLILDPTYFGDWKAVVVSIPRSGRALPVAWRVFHRELKGESELSQNLIMHGLVREVVGRLHEAIQTVVIADREFAIADFFRFIKGLGKDFVIRVDAQTHIMHHLYSGALGELPITPGSRPIWFSGALYSKEEMEPVNLLAVWNEQQKEPWFIATSLSDPRLAERLYRKRMKIEHGFRDWKHHLRLKGTLRVESVGRASRLVTAVALLYWFLSLVGMRLDRPNYRAEVSYWGKPSYLTVALQLLQSEDEAALLAARRVINWLEDKLLGLRPPTPSHKLRYRCFRLWLHQTGSL